MSEMSRQDKNQKAARDLLIFNYIDALENGDLAQVNTILEQAFGDPELLRLLEEVEFEMAQELGLLPQAATVTKVRALIEKHLESTFDQEQTAMANGLKPLTIGEVAAQLKSKNKLPPALKSLNEQLLENSTVVPEDLSIATLKKLAGQLGVMASDFYWRYFKDAAIGLGVARSHDQMQLAAREQKRRNFNQPKEK